MRGKEELEEKDETRKMLRTLGVGACSCGRTVNTIWCVVHTFSSPVSFANFGSCRMVALAFLVLRYTNNHHHPYIDSTTMLSDDVIDRLRLSVQYTAGLGSSLCGYLCICMHAVVMSVWVPGLCYNNSSGRNGGFSMGLATHMCSSP